MNIENFRDEFDELEPLTLDQVAGVLEGRGAQKIFHDAGAYANSEDQYEAIHNSGLRMLKTADNIRKGIPLK